MRSGRHSERLDRESGVSDSWTTFIQWKGTDLCMDMYCPQCGTHNHYDGEFAYNIRCGHCKAVFEMPTDVPLKLVESPSGPVLDGEVDD